MIEQILGDIFALIGYFVVVYTSVYVATRAYCNARLKTNFSMTLIIHNKEKE